MADAVSNFAYTTVATAPSPATSGTSLTVATGTGSKFPATPFSATVWPINSAPTSANAEILRVTNVAGDVLTFTRQSEGTTARAIGVGDQIAQTLTAAYGANLMSPITTAPVPTPSWPTTFGTNNPGAVGNGSDFQVGIESISNTAHMLFLTFPRLHMTDGTNYMYLASSPPGNFPLTGSPTISIAMLKGTVSALAASGTLTVTGIGWGTGTITYTGKTGTGASGTLTGCTSSGLTTDPDTTERHAIWITDYQGAPIFWISDYGGMFVNDYITFAYGDVAPDNNYDIILGFFDDVNRNTGSAIFFGSDKSTTIGRGNDGFGNSQLVLKTGGSSGAQQFIIDAAGLYSQNQIPLGNNLAWWSDLYVVTVHGPRIVWRTSAIAQTATPAINTDVTDIAIITALASNITSMTTNLTGTPNDGDQLTIRITGTASRTIAWGAKFASSTVTLPTTTSGTAMLECKFEWNAAASVWRLWNVS